MEKIIDKVLMGKRLRSSRIAQKLTMAEFSERCGISERYYSDIERGAKTPKMETFVKIVNVANVTPQYLLQDSLTIETKEGFLLDTLNEFTPKQKALIEDFILKLADTLH